MTSFSMEPEQPGELIERIREAGRELLPRPTGLHPRLPEDGPPVRAVLFDVYGTLFVSGSGDVGTTAAFDRDEEVLDAVRAGGFEVLVPRVPGGAAAALRRAVTEAQERRRAQGSPSPEVEIREVWEGLLSFWMDHGVLAGEVSRAAVERVAVVFEGRTNPVWPMPGARELVEGLARDGVPLGIVSNAQFYTPLLFPALMGRDLAGLGIPPTSCSWSYAVGDSKPASSIFRGPLETLRTVHGVEPAEVVYVGNDMLNDVWTARGCGCRTALFAGDERSLRLREGDPRCAALRPDAVATHLDQLLSWIRDVRGRGA